MQIYKTIKLPDPVTLETVLDVNSINGLTNGRLTREFDNISRFNGRKLLNKSVYFSNTTSFDLTSDYRFGDTVTIYTYPKNLNGSDPLRFVYLDTNTFINLDWFDKKGCYNIRGLYQNGDECFSLKCFWIDKGLSS
ncbi:hypothetical protein, partial [Zhouia amylolytica]|uniref:hypothetical protein n=1 Tax=Zhouia amylolytica TaxID=376730 RepID=UPI0020CDD935